MPVMTGDAQDSSCGAQWTLAQRLRSRRFIGQDAVTAIHGRKLPLHPGRHLLRFSIVRGIRHHLEFATGEAAVLKGLLPAFTAAINARLIMSNRIPETKDSREMPYCIWHPNVPSEETLRQSCAVAGYTALHKSLDILPEVAIAEEARESGSLEIFEHIMKQLVKWKVFDDYTGTLSAPTPSPLNGDTVVRRELDYTQGFRKPSGRIHS
ncbi:uncharacterized protein HRG_10826 [Hirsutella rhossiliensis]|uniref:Uncharacterized protein n=1 Tax=Hirsutella rhossiliensis TaxID=111463 RepID=A0A9P8SEK5_9HYPO|nr:uncharacterized protein HRG_10826 [Hirsutella rhossiliensis]KAH0958131.1 hypothetical protein HRG_10826 [Hirsutella rhossiliensis]